MYAYPQVLPGDDLVFKNPHCQLCLASRTAQETGGEILDSYMCTNKRYLCQRGAAGFSSYAAVPGEAMFSPYENIYNPDVPTIPSFRILYDFKTSDTAIRVNEKLITVEIKQCPDKQIYVPFYQKCSAISCTRGSHLVGKKCVRAEKCLDLAPCLKNEIESVEAVNVLFTNTSNTVSIQLRLWYTLDDSGVKYDNANYKESRETQSKEEMWHQDTEGSYKPSVSNNMRFFDDALSLTSIKFTENEKKIRKRIRRDESQIQEQFLGKSFAQIIDPFVKREIILDNIITVEGIRLKWMEYKLKADEPNKTEQLIRLMIRTKHTLISNIHSLVNHTLEISEPGICSQNSSNSSIVGDYCIFFTLNCNTDLTHNNLMYLITSNPAVSGLVNAAHDNNFILGDITLSNALSDSLLKATQTINQSGPNELQSYCRDGTVLHSEVKSVVYNETGRSYNVEISDSLYALGSFMYSVKIDIDARTGAPRFSPANVSWCKEDFSVFDCNYTTVALNESHFIRYGTSIVMTNHTGKMNEFLKQFWGREGDAVNVREFVNVFQQLHGINDTVVYESNEFRVKNDQVFVCSDFNSSFEVVQESTASRLYSHTSSNKLEQLTTLVALCVSIMCLVVVLSVYSLVLELRNVPGRIVMSMSSALLLAQVLFLCCSHPRGLACEVYASVHHAAWLASSAWLTAMSVHLTVILYSTSHTSLLSSANSFKTISILCWGLPLLLAGCCFTLDKNEIVAIDYGKRGLCWIGNVQAMLFVFGIPLFILLAVTSVCAVFVIRAIRNSSDFRNKNTSTHKGVRKHLLLCINLGLLMGFNWIFYFVAVAVDAQWMWAVFIFTNGSQGLYIFLCYVARKSVLTKLLKRLNLCQRSSENRDRNVGSLPENRVTTLTTSLNRDVALPVCSGRQETPSISQAQSPVINYDAFKI